MSRRRFILLIAGAAIIWLVGAAILVGSQTRLRTRQAARMNRFVEEHERDRADDRYVALYEDAKRAHEARASAESEHYGFVAGTAMTIGILVLFCAIDRHRFMKRMAALGRPADPTEVG